MPKGDGTGPRGEGPGTGRGQSGMGMGQGRGGNHGSVGAVGLCVCPRCGKKTTHQRGVPCSRTACPDCGAMMTRGL